MGTLKNTVFLYAEGFNQKIISRNTLYSLSKRSIFIAEIEVYRNPEHPYIFYRAKCRWWRSVSGIR